MPCPWYSQGFCTSPKLEVASDAITSPERCLGDEARYRSCPYYVDPSSAQSPSRRRGSVHRQNLKVYAPIHALVHNIDIGCDYAEVITTEGGIRVAYCRALDRLLTRFEAELCSRHWRECPYRQIASKASS